MQIRHDVSGTVDLATGVITIEDTVTHHDPSVPHESMLTDHYRTVLDTKEQMVREALIKLGWTPPATPS